MAEETGTKGRPAPRGASAQVLRALALAGGALLFAMMLLTFADVAGRTLGRPIPGAKEATEVMLAMLVFLLLPVVTWERGHIVIDLLDGLTPGWLHAPQSLLIDLAGAAACAVAARALARQAALAYDYGDTIAYLDWPRGAIVGAMAGLMALTALAFAANALRSLRAAVRGRA